MLEEVVVGRKSSDLPNDKRLYAAQLTNRKKGQEAKKEIRSKRFCSANRDRK